MRTADFETVAPSPLERGTTYAVEDRAYRWATARRTSWVTRDYGAHWQSIVAGLPHDLWTRAIRPDDRNPALVYLGTEQGMWVSFDRGEQWQRLRNNMPAVSVRDIRIQPQFDDLVIATHGRSIWVMDDIRPLQELPQSRRRGDAVRAAHLVRIQSHEQHGRTIHAVRGGESAVRRADLVLSISPAAARAGNYDSRCRRPHSAHATGTNDAGINSIVWNFTDAPPVKWTGAANPRFQGPDDGATVVPGRFTRAHHVKRATRS